MFEWISNGNENCHLHLPHSFGTIAVWRATLGNGWRVNFGACVCDSYFPTRDDAKRAGLRLAIHALREIHDTLSAFALDEVRSRIITDAA